ncbi:hypothetical protein [Pseudomonas baetica]|uniref:hypothetical protein n=1 Tax=Pseudomonas baetica TaxID=674054 RepID=UPI0021AB52EB|nr:hypothetical protein [Pseudomonas baetica]
MKQTLRSNTFLCGMLAGVALVTGLWLVLLWGQVCRPVPTTQWVEKAYNYKLGLAQAIQTPKLVLVGGSSAMFGLDSKQLEQALGRPVINLGVNAGIKSPYIQSYARQAIKPGDWVLMPVEYPLFHDRNTINFSFIDYWWSHPGFRNLDVTAIQLAQVVWLTPLSRVLSGYRGLPADFAVSGLYGPQNLDSHGDQLHSDGSLQQIWMREAVERSGTETYGAQAHAWNENWDSWKALVDEVSAAGGCALFIAPPMLDRAGYHHGKEGRYYAQLPAQARAHGLNYAGNPFESMYSIENFFDTNYHLNASAREAYTRQIIELVKPEFASCKAKS